VEYEENEVRDLLALERPKGKKDNSKVMCFNCKELGHYVSKCPGRYNKVNMQDSVKNDNSKTLCWNCREPGHYAKECPEPNMQRGIDLVTCQKCNQKGHYARRCEEKSTSRLQKMG
jgi:cellular nucleic acid-binding protein